MLVLTQFIFELTFGMSAAMLCAPPSIVTSGYYRNNLYAVLGLCVLAALVAMSDANDLLRATPAIACAVLAYMGSVAWLYEKRRAGQLFRAAVAGVGLWGAMLAENPSVTGQSWLEWADVISAGLLLGTTMAAMLLGHWHLNAPGMSLAPLRRLTVLIGVATLARSVVETAVFVELYYSAAESVEIPWAFLALRWIVGLVATIVLVVMTWETLKIPNTQSATGILYVAVTTTFVGELTSALLSQTPPSGV